jgi:glycosyltransferase involved in cell wall biosynthesis
MNASAALREPGSDSTGRVYAVMPVFNRVEKTLACLRCLATQTVAPGQVIVVDGGSSDGTPELVRKAFPDVVLLSGLGELWWGGATAAGIAWALEGGACDDDYVLMVNNDTLFGPDTLASLLETSHSCGGVVGALVVNERRPNQIIDGGVNISWDPYAFSTEREPDPGRRIKADCDVLPGRCTLVPVSAIRAAGNVDHKAFPHYLADYEFTHRLKHKAGVPLVIDYRALVRTEVDPPSPTVSRTRAQLLWECFNRRSKSNLVDHVRFVLRHAPAPHRTPLAMRLVLVRVYRVLTLGPVLGPVMRTLRRGIHAASALFIGMVRRPRVWLLRLRNLFMGSYLVAARDCRQFGLTAEALVRKGVLVACGFPGHYLFRDGWRVVSADSPAVVRLHRRASSPLFKLRRFLEVRGVLPVEESASVESVAQKQERAR